MKGMKTGGRKKGTPNKNSMKEMEKIILQLAAIDDVAGILELAKQNPSGFYKLTAKYLAKLNW